MIRLLKYIASGGVVVGGLIAGLVTSDRTLPNFQIQTISAGCLTAPEPIKARTSGHSIIITATISAANPCHTVGGTVSLTGNSITGNLVAQPTGALCVQCVGQLVAEIVVSDLAAGFYTIRLDTADGPLETGVELLE
jgi:hypothetical protein